MASAREIVQIRITDDERISGVLELAKLQQAIIALQDDGVVIINNAVQEPECLANSQIDTNHLKTLSDVMVPLSYAVEKDPETHYNGPRECGNFTQNPPLTEEYLFQDIWSNQITATILENILGPKPELRFVGNNVAMNGTARQDVHADLDFDDHLDFPFSFTVNFFLSDCSPANGITEYWVGTHHRGNRGIRKGGESLNPYIIDEEISKRRLICPPVRPTVPKGSVIIRDLRIWHCGVPNETPVPRHMLGLIYFPAWYANEQRTQFPESSRKAIERMEGKFNMLVAAEFLPDKDYNPLKLKFRLDYGGAGRGSKSGHKGVQAASSYKM